MKPLVIYHANCTDGFAAAFAAWTRLAEGAEYLPMRYLDKDDDMHAFEKVCPDWRDRDLYILDFSLPRKVTDTLIEQAKTLTWRDHHKSAFEMMGLAYYEEALYEIHNSRLDILLVGDKCGSMLSWELFQPNTFAPKSYILIDDYDRWKFNHDETKVFQLGIRSYEPWSFIQWFEMGMHSAYKNDLNKIIDRGTVILDQHNEHVRRAVSKANPIRIVYIPDPEKPFEVKNAKGRCTNAPANLSSDVGNVLSDGCDFGMTWSAYVDQENMQTIATCSIRGNGKVDVSTLARFFGGGGHPNAAGFSIPLSELLPMFCKE